MKAGRLIDGDLAGPGRGGAQVTGLTKAQEEQRVRNECTSRQRRDQKLPTSSTRGVQYKTGVWNASVSVHKIRYFLGTHYLEAAAIAARQAGEAYAAKVMGQTKCLAIPNVRHVSNSTDSFFTAIFCVEAKYYPNMKFVPPCGTLQMGNYRTSEEAVKAVNITKHAYAYDKANGATTLPAIVADLRAK